MDLINISIDRNAYGSQIDSFEDDVIFLPTKQKIKAVFIRAPKITRVGKEVEVLAVHKKNPVLVRKDNVLVSTFHPEYLNPPVVHKYFFKNNI